MNCELVEIVRSEWLDPIHLDGNFAWHLGFGDQHLSGPGAAAAVPFCRRPHAARGASVGLRNCSASATVIGPCIPGVKIVDKREHLFLGSVDSNRSSHAE